MTWAEFRELIIRYFSQAELDAICADLGIDHETIDGENKVAFVYALTAYLRRVGNVPELVEILKEQRPKIDWSLILDAPLDPPKPVLPVEGGRRSDDQPLWQQPWFLYGGAGLVLLLIIGAILFATLGVGETPTPTITAIAAATETNTPTATPQPSTATATTQPSSTPTRTASPTSTATPTASSTPRNTEAPTATNTPTPTPTATQTPTPTNTPVVMGVGDSFLVLARDVYGVDSIWRYLELCVMNRDIMIRSGESDCFNYLYLRPEPTDINVYDFSEDAEALPGSEFFYDQLLASPPIHEVMPGDTLSGLALRYYGRANLWPEICVANRDRITRVPESDNLTNRYCGGLPLALPLEIPLLRGFITPTPTIAPTNTATNTPRPTNTPQPTSTPRPTRQPTATPSPVPPLLVTVTPEGSYP